jgi:hypothetical protein
MELVGLPNPLHGLLALVLPFLLVAHGVTLSAIRIKLSPVPGEDSYQAWKDGPQDALVKRSRA